MRSLEEIRFRLSQEGNNLAMYLLPPQLGQKKLGQKKLGRDQIAGPLTLPDPEPVVVALRGSGYEQEIVRLAEQVLEHRIVLFGQEIDFGPDIPWRRDAVHGAETDLRYFRRIPYLDFAAAGDHKWIWELNRHQHLVVLAQAWRFTGRPEFLRELDAQLASWRTANPLHCGINWTSALEVGFRALSWIWVWHLVGDRLADPGAFLTSLYQHGRHLEHNLSHYFSPNTHLLGEAVALHALGKLFPEFPRAEKWRAIGSKVVEAELIHQVHPDGSHFEQSTYYHLYALDFFLFHRLLLDRVPEGYDARLTAMAEYLYAVGGGDHPYPFFGDDDGGRLFHPYGARSGFHRATLATCSLLLQRPEWMPSHDVIPIQAAWWLGAPVLETPEGAAGSGNTTQASQLFPDTGIAVLRKDATRIVIDVGPFGPGRGGHSHADALSLVVHQGDAEILIDPATYTYIADPQWRNWFRGTAAHNTVCIDGASQATPQGPFGWQDRPSVQLHHFDVGRNALDATCQYRGFTHRRRIVWGESTLWILDTVEGPDSPHKTSGQYKVEQFWHPGQPVEQIAPQTLRIGSSAYLALTGAMETHQGEEHGWRSRVLGSREPAVAAWATWNGKLPVTLAAALCFGELPGGAQLVMSPTDTGILLSWGQEEMFFDL